MDAETRPERRSSTFKQEKKSRWSESRENIITITSTVIHMITSIQTGCATATRMTKRMITVMTIRLLKDETIALQTRILAKNDALAQKNRAWFRGREILALNLVSSPGSGKTTLLERTIRDLKEEMKLFVVEGDQATAHDGERIRAAGAMAAQINTGAGCHLEADMLARALQQLKPSPGSLVMIENVGNLVCPALFDLGERSKIVIFSVTEGEDKPLKYPHMFRAAEVMILNKIDLLPHVDFDVARAVENALQVNPRINVFQLSARTGEGLEAWYAWLRGEMEALRDAAFA